MKLKLLAIVPFVLGLVGCGERPQVSEQQLADNMLAAIHVTNAAQKVAMASGTRKTEPCKE